MNLIGTKVKHKKFGEGEVVIFDEIKNRLTVQFAANRFEFKYPLCFVDKFLTGSDKIANTIIEVIIDEYIEQQQELKSKEKEAEIIPQCEYDATRAVSTINFNVIVRDRIYGNNTRKIYEAFCDTLNWDRSKAGKFGLMGTPLFAVNADTYRTSDVWFIPKPNRNDVSPNHGGNWLSDNCNTITEIVSSKLGHATNNNRITFLSTKKGYVFLGVYKITQNGLIRIFKKISDIYPLPD